MTVKAQSNIAARVRPQRRRHDGADNRLEQRESRRAALYQRPGHLQGTDERVDRWPRRSRLPENRTLRPGRRHRHWRSQRLRDGLGNRCAGTRRRVP